MLITVMPDDGAVMLVLIMKRHSCEQFSPTCNRQSTLHLMPQQYSNTNLMLHSVLHAVPKSMPGHRMIGILPTDLRYGKTLNQSA